MDVETELSKDKDLEDSSKPEEVRKIRLRKRSRSRTPQKTSEDPKILHVSLKKLDEEVNGGDDVLKEDPEEPKKQHEENGEENDKVQSVKGDENGTIIDASPTEEKENCFIRKEEPINEDKENGLTEQDVEEAEEAKEIVENCTGTEDLENGISEESCTAKNNGIKESEETEANDAANIDEQEEKHNIPKLLTKSISETETVEMDPLVIGDEVETELQFLEENSDKDSGKGSPIIPRCFTRRSYTRNIPTPKTPKLAEDPDSEKNSVVDQTEEAVCNLPNDIPKTDFNDSNDSLDTAKQSTNVEVGGNSTRLNFLDTNDSSKDDHFDESYLNRLRERTLSARRPLRATEDYRRKVLRNAQYRSDLNSPYDSVDQLSIGSKRKNRSITPEDVKKFKIESPGYRNFFSSPLTTLKNRFNTDIPSSTPELLGYKDEKGHFINDSLELQQVEDAGDDEKKSWCSIM